MSRQEGNSGGALSRNLIHAQIDLDEVQKLCHTADFDADELKDIVLIRRGCSINVQLRQNRRAKIDWADSATLECVRDQSKKIELDLNDLDVRVYGASLQVGTTITKTILICSG